MDHLLYKLRLLLLLLCLSNCGDKKEKGIPSQSDTNAASEKNLFVSKSQFQQAEMRLGSLETKAFPLTVQVNGLIDVPPENRAVVSATMGGYIKTTPFLIGDQVRKGQALITLENPEYVSIQQEYLEIHEQLTYLKAAYERQQTMVTENITSQKNFLKAESDYKSARARHSGLRKQLALLNILPSTVEKGIINSIVTIYAPISGSITKVNITRGTYVSPSTPILEIINNDHIHLELAVFEKDILKLKKGQKINFKIPESSDEQFEAEIYLIGTSIDENRTIKVHGHIKDETSTTFLTGMFVTAEVITDSQESSALPETAVVIQDKNSLLLKVAKESEEGYYFEPIEVKTGIRYDGYISLVDQGSLALTDKILTKGAFNLIENE
ncbi:efflux RND transporter periplasmic adaptor subunit [Flavobacteriaceae bacterium M23B6Z8]